MLNHRLETPKPTSSSGWELAAGTSNQSYPSSLWSCGHMSCPPFARSVSLGAANILSDLEIEMIWGIQFLCFSALQSYAGRAHLCIRHVPRCQNLHLLVCDI